MEKVSYDLGRETPKWLDRYFLQLICKYFRDWMRNQELKQSHTFRCTKWTAGWALNYTFWHNRGHGRNQMPEALKKKIVHIFSTSTFSTSSPLNYCLLLIVSENDLCREMLSLSGKNTRFDTLEVPAIFHNIENYYEGSTYIDKCSQLLWNCIIFGNKWLAENFLLKFCLQFPPLGAPVGYKPGNRSLFSIWRSF